MHTFRFKGSSQPTDAAQLVGETLNAIREQDPSGVLHMAAVVEASRPKTAPLHNRFEWSDKAAAHKWRLEQARLITRSIEIVTEDAAEDDAEEDEPTTITIQPAYVQIRAIGEGYRQLEMVMADEKQRGELIEQAAEDFRAYRRRWERLSALKEGMEAMEAALNEAQAAEKVRG